MRSLSSRKNATRRLLPTSPASMLAMTLPARATERRNAVDRALNFPRGCRREVQDRTLIGQPPGLLMIGVVAREPQRLASAGEQPHEDLAASPCCAVNTTDRPSGDNAGDSSSPRKSVIARTLGSRPVAPRAQCRAHDIANRSGGEQGEARQAARPPPGSTTDAAGVLRRACAPVECSRLSRSNSRSRTFEIVPRASSPGSGGRCVPVPDWRRPRGSAGGSSLRIAMIVSADVARRNGGNPASIS